MTFNQFMHPRNIYRRKPNYEELARIYPEFNAHLVRDSQGRAAIDYSNPAALRALTSTLLKKDFGLNVQIPEQRLVPTLPMRINYLLWVEDLLACGPITKNGTITGLDIGTGCCAIFPLLGVTMNKNWNFIATDIDSLNLEYANLNVTTNDYTDRIKVYPGSKEYMFTQLFNNKQVDKIDFIMTNPPFFSDSYNDSFEDAPKKTTKSTLHQKKSCTSVENEAVVEGGEVAFVKRIIEESLQVKDSIPIYTVMMGKRQSFLELKYIFKDYLRENMISSFTHTELCQGNTKRWALAWTFSSEIHFDNAPRIKCLKGKPLVYYVPISIECCEYNLKSIAIFIENLLKNDLQIETYSVMETKKSFEFDIKSALNSWGNQRKKRRQQLNKQKEHSEDELLKNCSGDVHSVSTPKREFRDEEEEMICEANEVPESDSKRLKDASVICKSDLTFLLHCGLKIKRDKQQVYLKMITKEMSQNKESTLQLLQYFKNKLI